MTWKLRDLMYLREVEKRKNEDRNVIVNDL